MGRFRIIRIISGFNITNAKRITMNMIHDGTKSNGYFFSSDSGNEKLGDSHKGISGTLGQLKKQLAKEMGVDHVYQPYAQSRAHLAEFLPKSQDELPKRTMKDSFIAAIIPLEKNEYLQEKYTTFLGSVRLGRLLEDMDIFAVIVARKHILNPKIPKNEIFPQNLVTVLVDRIDFTDYVPKSNKDIKISGHVSWVGKSTLEVVVWLDQFNNGTWMRLTRALFLLAARDPTNSYASVVNPLEPADDKETTILSGGEMRKRKRMEIDTTHVSKVIPNAEEQKIIHNIYLKTTDPKDISTTKRVLPTGCVWMSNSKVSSVIMAQPEDRNLHNTVFGGFIMRQAIELSWVLGYMFSKYRPRTRSVSDISFKSPIAVNSLIQMHATVVYTHQNYMQVLVFAEVYHPLTGKSNTTNAFHFTVEAPEVVPEVIPLTYHEAMLYIDGRRHFNDVMKDKHVLDTSIYSKL